MISIIFHFNQIVFLGYLLLSLAARWPRGRRPRGSTRAGSTAWRAIVLGDDKADADGEEGREGGGEAHFAGLVELSRVKYSKRGESINI